MENTSNTAGAEEMISIPKSQLETLLAKVEDYETDIGQLIFVTEGIIKFLGLTDPVTGKIKEAYLTKEENPMPAILKAAGGLVMLTTQAQMGGRIGKEGERKMAEKFSFITVMLPLLKKYA